MNVEDGLMYKLLATSGVTSLVNKRIYYVKAPQDVQAPYIVYNKVSAVRHNAHDGALGYVNSVIQISCYATTYQAIKSLVAAVKAAINGFVGYWGQFWWLNAVYINSCFLDAEVDLFDEGTELLHVACDYRITHGE